MSALAKPVYTTDASPYLDDFTEHVKAADYDELKRRLLAQSRTPQRRPEHPETDVHPPDKYVDKGGIDWRRIPEKVPIEVWLRHHNLSTGRAPRRGRK